ncbi:MAG: TolC family outer membrane protein [Pseudomonadota bacterium]|nr:TolC family outer membrane protein [Pseudomonadota bacterium]
MAQRFKPLALAATLLCAGAHAMTFQEALDAARGNDAAYRSAGYEYDAAKIGVPIARAGLLPAVSLTASDSKIVGIRTFPNGLNQEVRVPLDYTAPQASLNLRVPIFNYESISVYRQAKAQSEVAEAVFRTQGLDLIERVTGAYLQTLLSEDVLRLSQAQVTSLETQAEQTQRRLDRGEGTKVQVAQTLGNLDVSRARVVEARDQVDLARAKLAQVTGVPDARATELPKQIEAEPLFPDRLGDWVDLALRDSPLLQARERNREVARQAVQRQKAGHLPRLDLVAGLAKQQNDSTTAIGQNTEVRSIGLQLTVPLYSGGGIDAGIEQAQIRQAQVEEQVRLERDTILVDVQRYFQAVVNSEKKVSAYATALDSTTLAEQGSRRALEIGVGTVGDLAIAQAATFSAARDLSQSRIEGLLSRVRLMLQAGMSMHDVAEVVDRFLAGPGSPSKAATTTTTASTPTVNTKQP